MASRKLPRILIAAPKSGSGKTLISCGLMQIFKEEGKEIRAYKCGPDYIDPMFHRRVLGIPSENLDTFFARPDQIREQLGAAWEMALIEGVMGLYDGVGGIERQGSAYHVAQITDTPIILVMDVRGMGITQISLLKGLLADDIDHRIKGIILNRISAGFYEKVRPMIQSLGITPLGYLPMMKGISLESRHLGLRQPEEIESLNEQIRQLAKALRASVDLEALEQIAAGACELSIPEKPSFWAEPGNPSPDKTFAFPAGKTDTPPVLAVARDAAFSFYYEANLRLFREAGVRIREFSPLYDKSIPEDADALLLGGGYPELYCQELSGNQSMRESVRKAVLGGMPSLAECGGFLYLHETLTSPEGKSFPMVGLIPGGSKNTGKLCRFGYVQLHKKERGSDHTEDLLPAGEKIKGHEFHYYDSEENGRDCIAVKAGNEKEWECACMGENHLWGFAHLYYPSNPHFLQRFIGQMAAYKAKREGWMRLPHTVRL